MDNERSRFPRGGKPAAAREAVSTKQQNGFCGALI
jgi:hypothetical protein